MRFFHCNCGNRLFFKSTQCTACGAECGWCDACRSVNSLVADGDSLACGNDACGKQVRKCQNWLTLDLCNCYFPVMETAATETDLCRSCQMTVTIPPQTPENIDAWRALEAAKRRLLYELDCLILPTSFADDSKPPLVFKFMIDEPDKPVMTGHADGVVTINLKEAQPVEREIARQEFGEPHRTMIGHFRHEVSHYYWQVLIEGQNEQAFIDLFGDHNNPAYGEAMPTYYKAGPPADWQEHYISRYAASHPWEDFAETAAFYLDMVAVLDTAARSGQYRTERVPVYDCEEMISDYSKLGIASNEVNRCLGLTDLLPEVVSPEVRKKLQYVHALFGAGRA